MCFMTQLFNNEYFGIGLIVTIAFLTVLFIIVLIMALKDAKKRSKEMEVPEEAPKTPSESFAFKEEAPKEDLSISENKEEKVEIVPTVPLEKEEIVAPLVEEPVELTPTETPAEPVEEKKELDDFKTADFSFEDLKEKEVSAEKEPTVNIDFEALAESLKTELDKETREEPKKEEVAPTNLFDSKTSEIPSIDLDELKRFANELQTEEEKPLLENKEEEIKVVEDNTNTPAPVYLNSEEKVVKEEKVFEPVKMKVPTMEMPKFASAPANSVKVSKVEPVEDKKEEVITPSFESIENETFSLK